MLNLGLSTVALKCQSQSQNENTTAKSKTQQITKHHCKEENMATKQKHNYK